MFKRTPIKVNLIKSTSVFSGTRLEPKPKLKDWFIRAMGSRLITKSHYQKAVPMPNRTYEWFRMVVMNPFVEIPRELW